MKRVDHGGASLYTTRPASRVAQTVAAFRIRCLREGSGSGGTTPRPRPEPSPGWVIAQEIETGFPELVETRPKSRNSRERMHRIRRESLYPAEPSELGGDDRPGADGPRGRVSAAGALSISGAFSRGCPSYQRA
jgi:hypothetical protein